MEKVRDILLVGGGRFGRLALERLPGRIAAVAEPAPDEKLRRAAAAAGSALTAQDARQALALALDGPAEPPRWIIPAAPVHLLALWLCDSLAHLNPRPGPVPPELADVGAMAHWDGTGRTLYLSLADFLCPDDCPEPAEICTHTGKPRGEPMFGRIAGAVPPGLGAGVLRSRQLAPGVGGMQSAEMLGLRGHIAEHGGDWLIATSCRCHAVLSRITFNRS